MPGRLQSPMPLETEIPIMGGQCRSVAWLGWTCFAANQAANRPKADGLRACCLARPCWTWRAAHSAAGRLSDMEARRRFHHSVHRCREGNQHARDVSGDARLHRAEPALPQRVPGNGAESLLGARRKQIEPERFTLMIACAEICQTSASFILIGTSHHRHTCRECADICRRAAAAPGTPRQQPHCGRPLQSDA